MPIKVLMPALSPTMTEGNLAKWHKKEGDTVEAGDLLAEIETDKATMEVEAVDEGVIGKIIIPDGTQNVAVNAVIAFLLEEGESADDIDLSDVDAAPAAPKKEAPVAEKKVAPAASAPAPAANTGERIFASPLARRIADQKNLSLETIQGSGPHGRIIKRDVEGASGSSRRIFEDTGPAFEDKPVSTMRKVIAERLVESKQTVPHFYLTVDCAIDALLQARKGLNEGLADQGKKITVNDFVIWASAMALQENPEANASWMGDTIRYYNRADVSVAVAIEGGLITPIVKNAHRKTIVEISDDVKNLVKKAHAGQLSPEEFQGGSFSVSNLGMYGIQNFQAIVNPPQACILAVGAGEERPVVKDGCVEIQTMMTCTLSVDHRVVDGKVGAELLGTIKRYLENPWLMLAKGHL